jgi:hypothetical protein
MQSPKRCIVNKTRAMGAVQKANNCAELITRICSDGGQNIVR